MLTAADIQRIASVLRAARFHPDHEAYAQCVEIVARHVASEIAMDLKHADLSEKGFLSACGVAER